MDLKFDVDKFWNYATETLKTLCDARRDNKQAALKLYKALVTTKTTALTLRSKPTRQLSQQKIKTCPSP
eukprot:10741162-Ditylum_brightwellii.AAC.1